MSQHDSYLILHNVSKDSNFGFLIRTANAMGAKLIMVGRKNLRRTGAVGGTRRTPLKHFYSMREAIQFVRDIGCDVLGVEIMPDAKPVGTLPFRRSTAFLIGNEGEGLVDSQIEKCDGFVYVPQYGSAVSMNVNAATAIVLHRFAEWAEMKEAPREGRQFAARMIHEA